MAGKKPSTKPGRKTRPDSAQRSKQVLFRMQDLYPGFEERTVQASINEIARRDLQRFWSLMNHQLRHSTFRPADVERLGREVMSSTSTMALPIATVLASYIDTYAVDIKATSLIDLPAADSMALADLYARSANPAEAAEKLTAMQV